MEAIRAPIVQRAINSVGGGAELARRLGIKNRQAVYQWSRVPAERVLDVERVTGIPRHELRPDLYPAPVPQQATG